jgi:hypothetical protein
MITPRDIKELIAQACDRHGIEPARFSAGHIRGQEMVAVRREVWAAAYRAGAGLSMLARVTGFDHTTIRNGLIRAGAYERAGA